MQTENAEVNKVNKKKFLKPFILFFIVVLIVVYVAVPTYGTIRDFFGEGNLTFVLGADVERVEVVRPDRGILGKILDFLFPNNNGAGDNDGDKDSEIEEKYILNLRGRVVYEGCIPYPNGLIEFLSEPRYTRTDQDGYFYFDNVVEGKHTVKVLDDSGNVLASGEFEVLWDESIDETKVEIGSDGVVLFKVEITTVVLEMCVVLKKGDKGEILGIDRMELMTEHENGEETPTPKPPVKPPGGTDASGGTTKPPVDPPKPPNEGFGVDDSKKVYTEGAATDINIFGNRKYIAPGSSGKYTFNVENMSGETYVYTVSFEAADNIPGSGYIPMEYKLQREGSFISGDENTWVSLSALSVDDEITTGKKLPFILHWQWPEGTNDNDYIQYAGLEYTLTVKVTGQSKGS